MEQTFSRRGFLKGAAAAALAVSAMGLTGCSTDAGAEPSTAVILGDYKVDLDLKRSVLGKNGDLQVCRISVLRELSQGEGIVSGSLQVGQLLAAHLHLLALRQALSGVSLLLFHGFLPFRLSLRRG